ncbi:MAG: YwaF family protein [Clostridiales Family XIII bacterium]|jgi:hypothetical integral membrane protein (TIGR02206 family)|nr:YwaF family protein [Clostridiales Family XIII bacterium]
MSVGELFITYRDQIPEGVGFKFHGLAHILFLIGIAAFIVTFYRLYKRAGLRTRRRMRIGVAAAIVLMEAAKQIIVAALGVYTWDLLPLHLCGMSIFLIAIHAAYPNKAVGEILYSLSIPGAVSALLFADWTMYPILNIFCLQSFFIHMLELTYPFMLLGTGEIRPSVKRLWVPSLYLLVTVPIIYHLNHALDTNFFFINESSPGSPMALLETFLGNPGYVFGTIGILVFIWIVMYAPIVIMHRRRKKKRAGAKIAS